MFTKILTFVLIVRSSAIDIKGCDDKGVLFYEQFTKCKPVVKLGQLCPYKYVCPDDKIEAGMCLFQGKEYNNRDDIEKRGGCNQGCRCKSDEIDTKIECPEYDCPRINVWEGCFKSRKFGDCCPDSVVCPPKNATTCNFEGKEYYRGQMFYPENTCYECICRDGFKGDLVEPFCKKVSCGLSNFNLKELEQKCSPFYYKSKDSLEKTSLCCPLRFICGEAKVRKIKKKGVRNGPTCYLKKNFHMYVGDVFEVEYKKHIIECACHLPPYAVCTGDHL